MNSESNMTVSQSFARERTQWISRQETGAHSRLSLAHRYAATSATVTYLCVEPCILSFRTLNLVCFHGNVYICACLSFILYLN